MPSLYIFAIHTASLAARQARFHSVIQTLRTTAQAAGYEVKPIFILQPDVPKVREGLPATTQRVKLAATGEAEFDKHLGALTLEELSNYEKHREAWRRVIKATDSAGVDTTKDRYMVLEDDVMLFRTSEESFRTLLQQTDGQDAYDLLFLGMQPAVGAEEKVVGPGKLHSVRELGSKVLPSKEAYLITPSAAKALLQGTENIRFAMRIQLSLLCHTIPDLRVCMPSARITLDGSKLCIFPSSIHANNMPYLNREYMIMQQMLFQKDPVSAEEAKAYYTSKLAHLNNPDAMHVYALMLLRVNKIDEAEELMTSAVEEMKKQGGVLHNRSDLLHNLFRIFQGNQPDLEEAMTKASKYAVDGPLASAVAAAAL